MKERGRWKYSKHGWLGERDHKDKVCGYDEGLPLEQHEEMTNFCFSFFSAPHFLLFPSPEFRKSLYPGNSELKHQKEMTAEYENFYIKAIHYGGHSATMIGPTHRDMQMQADIQFTHMIPCG